MIKILVVDDHTLFRKGLIEILKKNKRLRIVGEAANSREALESYKKKMPDIMLMDISLPDKSGIETTKEILKINPKQKIIILSRYEDEEHILEAYRSGASGYFIKARTVDELFHIINTVEKEGAVIHQTIVPKLLKGIKKQESPQEKFKLTDKELEILKLLKKALSNKEIAQQTNTSERTIKNHLNNIFQKLGVENRTQVVLKIFERDIV